MFVSPMEHHPLLSSLGANSSECEKLGVDFLFLTQNGLVGVQRKAVSDLVASVRGDRIQREIVQMNQLDQAVLLVEGDWRWRDGIHAKTGYSLREYRGLVLSVQSFGIWHVESDSVEDTANYLLQMESWFAKPLHESLLRKPKAKVHQSIHILQHFDGISLTRAKAIYEYFGRVPLKWDVTLKDIESVPGIGKVTAAKLWKALQ